MIKINKITKVPEHVGIIPDGNRRLARRLMKRPWKGHEWGFEKVKKLVKWCKDYGIKVITFYTLSLENLKNRPKREIEYLFNLARKELRDILENKKNMVHREKVRLHFFGKLKELPKDIREGIKKVEKMTEKYSDIYLNFAIAYGGRQEIIEVSKKIAGDVKKGSLRLADINENTIRKYLWTNGFKDPDLIIRTGGEKRLSNFLPFQSVYSELVFVDSLWPEFSKKDLSQVISEFQSRERRFGK